MSVLTYKYRVKDRSAKKELLRQAYAVNQVWNWCAAQQRDITDRYRAGAPKRRWPSHFDLDKQCKGVGADLGILQMTVGAVCKQFAHSRDKVKGAPRFRSSFGEKRALGWVPIRKDSRRVDGNQIIFAGRAYRFWEGGRPVPANAKDGAFVEDARGRWFVTFCVEVANDNAATEGEIGIDLGLKSLTVTSDGETVENPRHLQRYAERLAIAQRAGNKGRVRALHAKIGNVRRDFHHKLSTRLAREYAFIAVGNVNAKSLVKTRMAKSVLDAGWSSFRDMLRYKAKQFVEVDERFTTQTCSSCGSLPPERPRGIAGLGIREWSCSACGASHDRDVNAALNILALGRSVAPRADESRRVA